jgi:3-oxoacyl-[acyl-carrier-protein] synthase III
MMQASIGGIEYFLPARTLTTAALSEEHPDWGVESIDAKTGIYERHIAGEREYTSDLAVAAARKLFDSGVCSAREIDFVLLCTQTPDYILPGTSSLVQDRLGIRTSAGALDFNLGSSGYVYGLGLAQGLIVSGQASRVLLLTADTYSKLLHPHDRSVRTIFGDAAAATLVVAQEEAAIGPFVYGTDGRGAPNLIVPAGGLRQPATPESRIPREDELGNLRSDADLYMNGMEIFNFTLSAVPGLVNSLLQSSGRAIEEIDLFVFHQANRMMLDQLRKRCKIPAEKFSFSLRCGNTVSCTIPICLKDAVQEGRLTGGAQAALIGFGVGYSWGATIVRWPSGVHS